MPGPESTATKKVSRNSSATCQTNPADRSKWENNCCGSRGNARSQHAAMRTTSLATTRAFAYSAYNARAR
eukprot:4318377-Lingulodinium_polyedra.AAC.1